MSEICPACQRRQYMLGIQQSGRQAAIEGKNLKDNPFTEELERQYWEYGWIEENFVDDINEHRAVMDYAGVELFQLAEKIDEMVRAGFLTVQGGKSLKASLNTITGKLADKLSGG